MNNRISTRSVCLLLGLSIGLAVATHAPARAQADEKTLVIASFGGQLDEAFKAALRPWAEQNKISIRMVPGTATENAAKIIATKNNPEFDLVLLENMSYDLVSRQGLLAQFQPRDLSNFTDLASQARLKGWDGLPVGFYFTGIYYNPEEFKKRNWAVPVSWSDLFRPEFCNHIGVMHPNVSYGLHTVLMLAGGKPEKMPEGIAAFGKLKGCIATLEPSSSKLEEKMQMGEYLLGTHGTIRAVPLINTGYPIRFVIPKEGSILAFSAVVAPKNSPRPQLAKDAMNWLIGPQAQKILMDTAFYTPVNTKVELSSKLKELGVPDSKMISEIIIVENDSIINDHRRDWARQIDRALTR